MNGKMSRLMLAALGTLLVAMNAAAVTPHEGFAAGPLQFAPLAIGTTLSWNTFLGGSGDDSIGGVAVDAAGNVYVVGSSTGSWGSPILPWVGAAGTTNVFVAKLDPSGALLWSTFLGGTAGDSGNGIAVDAGGDVFVVGQSLDTWGAPILPWAGPVGAADAFAARLDAGGNLLWHTFLGGTARDYGNGIAVDAGGNATVTGQSWGTWGAPILPWVGSVDAFVARLDTGGALLWNTFLGGAAYDAGRGVAVDAAGVVSVAGQSYGAWGTPIRPWVGPAGSIDAFAARLDAGGALLWHTFLGGAGSDSGYGIAAAAGGSVYVAGTSSATWAAPVLPWTGSAGQFDGFAARLDTDGALLWNTFLGGVAYDAARGIAVGPGDDVYVTGNSATLWGPPVVPWAGPSGAFDAFVVALNGSGVLLRNVFLGGAADESGNGIAVDALGGVHVAGIGAGAWGAPVLPFSGAYDVFVARVENASNAAPVAADQAPSIPQEAAAAITLSATDADGDSLTYTVLTDPAHGTLGGTPPDVTYQPVSGYVGTDAFTFQANDGWLESTIATVAITVTADVTPPVGSILINNGAASTGTPGVTLNLTATDVGGSGLGSMRFRNSTAEPYTTWEPFQSTRAWTLAAGIGTRRAYAQFMDRAGNVSDANPGAAGAQGYVDSILVVDATPPTGSILINNGAASTTTPDVTLNLTATDAGGSGLGTMRFRNSTAEPYTAWEPYQTTRAWTLLAGAGTRRVYVQFRDLAGNISDANPAVAGSQAYQDSITLAP